MWNVSSALIKSEISEIQADPSFLGIYFFVFGFYDLIGERWEHCQIFPYYITHF